MIQIILETESKHTSEATFLKTYLTKIIGDTTLSNKVEFLYADGKDNLKNLEHALNKVTDTGGKNLLIFDADTANNMGGFAFRKQKLLEEKAALGIEFELFLFPNNEDDGDFESLIEKMIPQNHQPIIECFKSYQTSIKELKYADGNCMCDEPSRKLMVYSYVETLKKSKDEEDYFKGNKVNEGYKYSDYITNEENKRKGKPHDYFFYNPKYWNLDHEYAHPLKDFLLEHIS